MRISAVLSTTENLQLSPQFVHEPFQLSHSLPQSLSILSARIQRRFQNPDSLFSATEDNGIPSLGSVHFIKALNVPSRTAGTSGLNNFTTGIDCADD
jgi:hypothetical protein